jgi:hypothetical protein
MKSWPRSNVEPWLATVDAGDAPGAFSISMYGGRRRSGLSPTYAEADRTGESKML